MKSAMDALRRGTVELVSEEELARKFALKRPLRVKLGVDPTSPDLHLGHTVVLQKLRAFQDMGHVAVLIIGDFTATVGDPSGRDATRPTLSVSDIRANAQTYKDQAFKVLDPDPRKLELRYNSEWLEPFAGKDLLKTMQRYTVQQLLAREDFQARLKAGSPITLLEILYPLLQGYDSVAVKSDVELGGNDQIFNLLMGRQMQKDAGLEPQVALTVPLLVGLDGRKKMSKSYGNAIALNDSPRDVFGKVMKVSDDLMWSYYELLTTRDLAEVKSLHPMEAKKALALELTARFHGAAAGASEREFFDKTFSQKEAPRDVAEVRVGAKEKALTWSAFLVQIQAVDSRKEAQRLIAQGALRANENKIIKDAPVSAEPFGAAPKDFSLKVGKHKFFKLRFD